MNNNILFVDDEIEILNTYLEIFQSEDIETLKEIERLTGQKVEYEENNFNVFTSNSGQEAIDLIKLQKKENPIAVVFLDMRMPNGLNGLETAIEITKIDPLVEIVFLTAYSDVNIKEINQSLPNIAKILYLKKPLGEDEIKQTASNLLAKYNAMDIQRSFISSVTHELRTPLTPIIGMADLLLDEDISEDNKEYVQLIKNSGKILLGLLDNLIEVAKLEQTKVNKEKLDLEELIKDIVVMFETDIDINIDLKNIKVVSDKYKLTQIIINLINNAIKFTKEGSIKIYSDVDCYNSFLIIEDTGCGIPEDKIDTIFNKFTRIEYMKNTSEGFGLGLFLVKKLINLLGHNISVSSELNKGTIFKIKF